MKNQEINAKQNESISGGSDFDEDILTTNEENNTSQEAKEKKIGDNEETKVPPKKPKKETKAPKPKVLFDSTKIYIELIEAKGK